MERKLNQKVDLSILARLFNIMSYFIYTVDCDLISTCSLLEPRLVDPGSTLIHLEHA